MFERCRKSILKLSAVVKRLTFKPLGSAACQQDLLEQTVACLLQGDTELCAAARCLCSAWLQWFDLSWQLVWPLCSLAAGALQGQPAYLHSLCSCCTKQSCLHLLRSALETTFSGASCCLGCPTLCFACRSQIRLGCVVRQWVLKAAVLPWFLLMDAVSGAAVPDVALQPQPH